MLKNKYIFQIKYAEAILSNRTRKLLWFAIRKNADCSLRNKFIVPFIIIFGTLSFHVLRSHVVMNARAADHNYQPKSVDRLTSRSVNAGDTVSSDVGDDSCS